MDSSSLVKAHDHARAAAAASRQASDTTVAINEHTLAAGEFANAARNTSSVEALRTLKLLEEHHRRLAEILRLPPERTSPPPPPPPPGSRASSSSPHDGDHGEKQPELDPGADGGRDAPDAAVSKAALPTLAQRYAAREMTSSIASNLASARGIRSRYRGQPLSPSVSNDQAPGNVDAHPRRDDDPKAAAHNATEAQSPASRPAWVPPLLSSSRQDSTGGKPEPAPPPKDDGGYARFYNTFGSLINKISAPLAFAGLPLIQEEPPAAPAEAAAAAAAAAHPPRPSRSPTRHARRRASPSAVAAAEPDLSKIYSRATLRALARDGHGPADSFYVVPSTGHTMSYANILSYAEKEKRRLEASVHHDDDGDGDDDDFVDAREAPASSAAAAAALRRRRRARDPHTVVEELSTENRSLKDMLDKLTRRLQSFEASAQSMALAESYRLMRPASPLAPPPAAAAAAGAGAGAGGRAGDDELARKNSDLEEQVAALVKQMERLEKDNRKMQKTLEKYREKWEVLKAGAKARREAQVTLESVEEGRT